MIASQAMMEMNEREEADSREKKLRGGLGLPKVPSSQPGLLPSQGPKFPTWITALTSARRKTFKKSTIGRQ
jgi:hypothetical protein